GVRGGDGGGCRFGGGRFALAGEETGIAASVLLLGLLMASMARLGIGHAALLVGLFALFHGHAHGAEMAAGADFSAYAAGFAAATALPHIAGIALGWSLLRVPVLYRGLGGLMGAWGTFLLFA
ncbi:HupE/UreJ family protein, partial [Methylogaea oryzae]|uniref:HupE/UreJ family protein n=1 Tax=Methylogaea oryzae TaxID=1295382 RepID=UPI000A7DE3FC